VAYYRTMAAEALELAKAAGDEALKASYVDIAARWDMLAKEVERRSARQPDKAHHSNSESDPQSNGERH
jgi:hypothetical protein